MAGCTEINTKDGTCSIRTGSLRTDLQALAARPESIVLADQRVLELWPDLLPSARLISLPAGENIKTLARVEEIYGYFHEMEADRSSLVIALGGGTLCDTSAFAATTWHRGLRFGLVPTTLLAQVDAAIGGKNGVNFRGSKNLIGTIRQPEFVWCDPEFLRTLPEREFNSGLAEIVKHALIADADLFSALERTVNISAQNSSAELSEIIHRSIAIKAHIITEDEQESGPRMLLNFGHTIGHAIESLTGLTHGEAISIGMLMETRISEQLSGLPAADLKRIEALLQKFRLPLQASCSGSAILEQIMRDKKRRQEIIKIPLLRGIGHARLENLALHELAGMLAATITK